MRLVPPLVGLALVGLALATCGRDGPAAASLGTAAEWIPLGEGRRWTYEASDGTRRLRVATRVFGGDLRSLEGLGRVPFLFVYGTPAGFDHEATKSIYAEAPDGPRLFHLDAMLWGLGFDPPVPLLPTEPRLGATWTWSGSLRTGREPAASTARLEVEALEEVVVPAGAYECLRVRQVHEGGSLELVSWYARGVGLVRCEWSTASPGRPRARGSLVLLDGGS